MKDDDDKKELTVRELIALLQALPEDQKSHYVGCMYDCDCEWTGVYGIHDVKHKVDARRTYVRLEGD